MAKEKKISFKYSFYKKAKPEKNEEGEIQYPVYSKITFNRTTTKFPLPDLIGNYGLVNSYSEKEFELNSGFISLFEKTFEAIIRFEYSKEKNPNSYSVIGVHKRYPLYLQSTSDIISKTIEAQLMNHVGDLLTFNSYIKKDGDLQSSFEYHEFDFTELITLPKVIFTFNWLYENIETPSRLCTQFIISQCNLIFEFFLFEMFYGHEYCYFDGGKIFIFDWYIRPKIKQDFLNYFKNGKREAALSNLKNEESFISKQILKFLEITKLTESKNNPLEVTKGINSILDNYYSTNKELNTFPFFLTPIVNDPLGIKNTSK